MIFTVGNIACALAPGYEVLMAARVVTSLAHGTFFGVGAVVATGLVSADRKASAISTMFAGLTVATLLGVPAGAWLGTHFGWRSTFWAVSAIGVVATVVIAALVPRDQGERADARFLDELRAVARPQVLLGLLMTALGFAGLFTVFTYIQPLLMQVSGFAEDSVSPILLVFGGGLFIAPQPAGRDRVHRRARRCRFRHRSAAAVACASAGARCGTGPGLTSVTWAAALVTLSGLAVALWSVRLERARHPAQIAAPFAPQVNAEDRSHCA